MIIENPVAFRENIQKKLNKLIRKKIYSLNLEKGIYNWAIAAAKKKNIVRIFNNHMDYTYSYILNIYQFNNKYKNKN